MTTLKIIGAAGAALALAACGGAPDPSGEISIDGDIDEITVGDVVNVRWAAENTNRVWVEMHADGKKIGMMDDAGFSATGAREFAVEETAFNFGDDDDVDVKFTLLARDGDNDGYETLESVEVEVNKTPE